MVANAGDPDGRHQALRTMFQKVWEQYKAMAEIPDTTPEALYVDCHLIHEANSAAPP